MEYFRKANGGYVSGEQISKDLKVSRTAIWKHINVLKERGYIFESSTRKGYRLLYAPDLLTPLEIEGVLRTESFGRKVVYFEMTPSTNEEAKKIAREGAEEGTIGLETERHHFLMKESGFQEKSCLQLFCQSWRQNIKLLMKKDLIKYWRIGVNYQ